MILTINVGSSSLKFASYDENLHLLKEGNVPLHEHTIDDLLKNISPPKIVGHRIVHGGSLFEKPIMVTEEILQKLETLIPFSPLHLPQELEIVKKMHRMQIRQVVCFDTAFHRSMPQLHQHFPLPSFLWNDGIKRYGFHGLSYEYILDTLQAQAEGKKLIIAHLGSGASMVAISDKKPIDTTMGFTPASGIMMATRSGDLDPGIFSYLIREKGYSVTQIDTLVNHQSGLLGISETTGDMEKLLQLAKKNPKAQMAISLFCYIAKKAIGSLAAALGGLDLLVFTGGIGEKSQKIREEICKDLHFLDIEKKIQVIPTNENEVIAKHTKRLMRTYE